MTGPSLRTVLAGTFPETLLTAWEAAGIKELLPIQEKAIAAGVLGGKSCLVVGPTSSGKTFVGELASLRQALNRRRSVCIVPAKAIAEERAVEFERRYAGAGVGAAVIVSTSERRDDTPGREPTPST